MIIALESDDAKVCAETLGRADYASVETLALELGDPCQEQYSHEDDIRECFAIGERTVYLTIQRDGELAYVDDRGHDAAELVELVCSFTGHNNGFELWTALMAEAEAPTTYVATQDTVGGLAAQAMALHTAAASSDPRDLREAAAVAAAWMTAEAARLSTWGAKR